MAETQGGKKTRFLLKEKGGGVNKYMGGKKNKWQD